MKERKKAGKGRKERRREGGWKTIKFLAMVGRAGYVLTVLQKRDWLLSGSSSTSFETEERVAWKTLMFSLGRTI